MRPVGSTPFVWPLALLAVGGGMIGLAHGLARLEGFRLYGLVEAMGEIVGLIGLVWLIVAALKIAVRRGRGA